MMSRFLYSLIVGLTCLALPCFAEQAPQPSQTDANNKTDIWDKLLQDLKNSKNLQPTAEGFGTVSARRARLCDSCHEPLYKHSDPDFQCIPKDANGQPKKMLEIQTRPVDCPVCQARFIGALRGNLNDHAGRDRDFCAHSTGKYSAHSSVWLCPECGYAGLIDGFGLMLDGKPLDDAIKKFTRENLSESTRKQMLELTGIIPRANAPLPQNMLKFGKYVLQTEIPDWIKYEHALKIYAHIKAPHTLLATLNREAAYACRRDICGEVAAHALHNSLQVSLGESIRRANRFMQDEIMNIRRQRGDLMIDPNKIETDPKILCQAAAAMIRMGEDSSARIAANPAQANSAPDYVRTGDMYIIYIRYAGALDRMGRLDEAEKMLDKACKFIPEKMTINVENQENKSLTEYFERQLKLLRDIVENRIECIKREREYLFNSAKHTLAAIKLKELKQKNCPKPGEPGVYEPAPTLYLLGEQFRRAAMPGEATMCFEGADRVITQVLSALDAAETQQSQPIAEINAQRDRFWQLKAWNDAQRDMIKSKDKADAYARGVIEMILADAGIAANTPAPVANSAATVITTSKTKEINSLPSSVGAIKTREQLYKTYYEALLRFRADKKQNPRALSELIKAGLIRAEDANLDENGKLFCPETKERLGYLVNWEIGDKSAPVLFPIKTGSKILFADGEIRESISKR